MNRRPNQNYDFIPGLDLCEIYYRDAVKPILDDFYPDLVYSTALMGEGSDVLGFDTPQSMDHDWGPRLLLFLRESDFNSYQETVDQTLRKNLPYEIRGFPTNFVSHDDGSLMMSPITSGQVNHAVRITTVREFFMSYFGIFPSEDLHVIEWLTIPEQVLGSVVNGRVFYDGLGELQPIIARLQYYPHDLWLYILANQWRRISQEDAFMGRCGQVGDELGSRIIAARLVRDMMRLCFIMERTYTPYIKWLGTAFSKLCCSKHLDPLFLQSLDADNWQERESYLVQAYEYVAGMHNELRVTKPVDTRTIYFHNRPFRVIQSDKFASELLSVIEHDDVKRLPIFLGGVDQYIDSTDVLTDTDKYRRLWSMYQ